MGDAFLRHFYQVYDYDRQMVRLAVDVHSKHIVSIGDNFFKEILLILFFALLVIIMILSLGRVYRCHKKKK